MSCLLGTRSLRPGVREVAAWIIRSGYVRWNPSKAGIFEAVLDMMASGALGPHAVDFLDRIPDCGGSQMPTGVAHGG